MPSEKYSNIPDVMNALYSFFVSLFNVVSAFKVINIKIILSFQLYCTVI